MEEKNVNKLVLAVMQKMDYDDVIQKLNQKRIFVTKLSSSGGFLKKENVTVMIGVEEERLKEVMDILEELAGRRRQTVYTVPTMPEGYMASASASVPVEMNLGGVTVFVMQMESFRKF